MGATLLSLEGRAAGTAANANFRSIPPVSKFGPVTEGMIKAGGKDIQVHQGCETIDVARAKVLIELSFGKKLTENYFWDIPLLARDGMNAEQMAVIRQQMYVPQTVLIEADYQGIAVIKSIFDALVPGYVPYLDKLAIAPQSKGNGIGKALMDCITAAYMPIIWRSGKTNFAANSLYINVTGGKENCGFFSEGVSEWIVFYHNMPFEQALRLKKTVEEIPQTLVKE